MSAAIVLLGLVALSATGLSASTGTEAKGCGPKATTATIAGRHVCLRAGARCQKQYQRSYRKHGLTCVGARLRRVPQLITAVKLPAASPLPATARAIAIQTTNSAVGELTSTNGAVWTSGGPFRIDAAIGAVTGPFTTGESNDLGAGEGSIWASDFDSDLVRRFDAGTGKLLATIQFPQGAAPEGITDSGGAIWVVTHHGGTLARA